MGALSIEERGVVLDVLHSERFVDQAPAQVFATLLDQDEEYLCSIRTMYRILAATILPRTTVQGPPSEAWINQPGRELVIEEPAQ